MQIEEIDLEKPPIQKNLIRKCIVCAAEVKTEDDWNPKHQPLSQNSVPLRGSIPFSDLDFKEIQCFICANCFINKSEFISIITKPRTVLAKRNNNSQLIELLDYEALSEYLKEPPLPPEPPPIDLIINGVQPIPVKSLNSYIK